jgi:hypothetical protein
MSRRAYQLRRAARRADRVDGSGILLGKCAGCGQQSRILVASTDLCTECICTPATRVPNTIEAPH